MKLSLTLVLLLTIFRCFGQTDSTKYQPDSLKLASPAPGKQNSPGLNSKGKEEVFRKNIVKINLSSLVLNSYNLSYERSLTRKITFVGGYSFIPKTNISSIFLVEKALDEFIDEDDDIRDYLTNSTVADKTYTGEIRFYSGKKPGARGLYLSLYGRYMNLDATYTHEYEANSNTYIIPIDGNVQGFGGGLMVGSQWLIAKRIAFDWYIVGGHFGKMKMNLTGTANLSAMTPEEQRDLEEEIESINDYMIGSSKVEATVTDNGVTVKGNTPFAGIRGLGFSLGIAF